MRYDFCGTQFRCRINLLTEVFSYCNPRNVGTVGCLERSRAPFLDTNHTADNNTSQAKVKYAAVLMQPAHATARLSGNKAH